MKPLLVALLVGCLLAVATGGARYAHEAQHTHEHADADHDHAPTHDEHHCTIHATLAAPAIAAGWTPVLISLGLLVAFLTELPCLAPHRRPAFAIDCRGPPPRA